MHIIEYMQASSKVVVKTFIPVHVNIFKGKQSVDSN